MAPPQQFPGFVLQCTPLPNMKHYIGRGVIMLCLTASGLAQLVECLTAELEVAGSIPGAGPILRVLK